jgi:Gram-negative bacterial TonB protein C-terminal
MQHNFGRPAGHAGTAMKTIGLLGGISIIVGATAAFAEPMGEPREVPLPTYRVLPCPNGCANYTKAVPVETSRPRLPAAEAVWMVHGYVEGFVDIGYTIGTDGHVREARVRRLLGPREFADGSLEAVKRWVFRPATLEGKPVEQISSTRFMFNVPWAKLGVRSDVAIDFRNAVALIKEHKLDEALAIVQRVQAADRRNFYERTSFAYLAALIHYERKAYTLALEDIRLALLEDGRYIDGGFYEPALRLGIVLETRAGEFAAALTLVDVLKKFKDLKPDDDALATAGQIRAALAGPNALAVTGWIPAPEEGDSWRHTLFRRTFGFDQIRGKLESVQLSCDQQAIVSPVQEGVEWHVPQRWSNCDVYVTGTPGSTFRLIELN